MMNILEEAIIYATIMHQGKTLHFKDMPVILHSLEVAHILSTMTDDQELITAGILDDVLEDTDGTLAEIEKRFGKRVADLIASESEGKKGTQKKELSWKRCKENSLRNLKNSRDKSVKMLWLADKLAEIRSIARLYSEIGEATWDKLEQSDPALQCWYYRSVAEELELSLNKTGAFKELIKHINFIWPGTFDSEKSRYRKYREISVDGCKIIGRGAKGEVYRYDDELVIKVFNHNNTYHDVEREIALSRRSFILGIPTAISFGIVAVGDRYGAMYELVDADTISDCIARTPGRVDAYAGIMADLALTIHGTHVEEDDVFPDGSDRIFRYIDGGIGREDGTLAVRCRELYEALPSKGTLIHGDFHTGNVFIQNGEALLIDMDRISRAHPIAEIGDLYYHYVIRGEHDPSEIEDFMGFSYQTASRFFDTFLKRYLDTEDEDRLQTVKEKASLLCYTRKIRSFYKKGDPTREQKKIIASYVDRIAELTDKLDSLDF